MPSQRCPAADPLPCTLPARPPLQWVRATNPARTAFRSCPRGCATGVSDPPLPTLAEIPGSLSTPLQAPCPHALTLASLIPRLEMCPDTSGTSVSWPRGVLGARAGPSCHPQDPPAEEVLPTVPQEAPARRPSRPLAWTWCSRPLLGFRERLAAAGPARCPPERAGHTDTRKP